MSIARNFILEKETLEIEVRSQSFVHVWRQEIVTKMRRCQFDYLVHESRRLFLQIELTHKRLLSIFVRSWWRFKFSIAGIFWRTPNSGRSAQKLVISGLETSSTKLRASKATTGGVSDLIWDRSGQNLSRTESRKLFLGVEANKTVESALFGRFVVFKCSRQQICVHLCLRSALNSSAPSTSPAGFLMQWARNWRAESLAATNFHRAELALASRATDLVKTFVFQTNACEQSNPISQRHQFGKTLALHIASMLII